jgi:hypothetical protein
MEQLRIGEAMYRVQHRHKDGSWADMEQVPNHHGAADHDPERSWGRRTLFRCRSCSEGVELTPLSEERSRDLR